MELGISMTKSNEFLEILQETVNQPKKGYPLPSDDGPANIYDRVAALRAEAKELRVAGKPMSARKKLNEATHFRRLVRKIERQCKT